VSGYEIPSPAETYQIAETRTSGGSNLVLGSGPALCGPRNIKEFILNTRILSAAIILIATPILLVAAPGARFAGLGNSPAASLASPSRDGGVTAGTESGQAAATQSEKSAQALKKYLEAQKLEHDGSFQAAAEAYKAAIELDPSAVDLKVALGSLYLKNSNYIEAEAQARQALKVSPNSVDAQKLLASVYVNQTFVGASFNKQKASDAIQELEQVAKATPDAKIIMGDQEVPALAVVGSLYEKLDQNDKAVDAFKRLTSADTSSDVAYFALASLYYDKTKFREAAEAAKKAYDISQKPQYAALLARSLLRTARTQEALDLYKKTLGLDEKEAKPDESREMLMHSTMVLDYAEALVNAGKYDEAEKAVDPVLKAGAQDSLPYLRAVDIKVDALRRSGKREEAVQVLQTAIKGQDVSDSLQLVFALAETYGEMQQFDKAIVTYEDALAGILNPDGTVGDHPQERQNAGVILTRIAIAYRTDGKRDKELATFERMKKVLGPTSPQPDELIINSLIDDGKTQEALTAADAAIKAFPDERSFKFFKAQAAGKLGDMKTADATLHSMLNETAEDSEVYSFWSSIQTEANMLKEAEDNARKAATLDPRDINALVSLSIILEREKKFKDSEASLRKALEIDPNNATLLNNLGYYLAERGERLPEAEDLIRRAVNIAPTNGSFLDSLGWLLFKEGKTDEARKYIEQAVGYSPRSGTIHDHLGDIYKKVGQNDKAKSEWEAGLKLSTDQDEIKKIKDKLGKMK
jgi:tetratricopeptide (TPR) repeat protein